ncbi:hypothetical protein GWK47_041314 [Chionoecetes opilio]|uniref:Uncharacterized protein n=1 Tax=Chionoecetes opilio TaxID=41210 RepID=A0A8J5CX93_CHIOP|nr:hypothetical protein GWK47_041314 [Chionoecetes opilio]
MAALGPFSSYREGFSICTSRRGCQTGLQGALCHSITSLSGVGFDSLHRLAANFTLCVFISWMCGTAAVKMFHILETRPTKVRWCWLARERGTSTASPLVSTVLVLRVAILGGCRNPARCGTPCTCALWNTTSAATSLRCSSESRGLTGLNWAGGSGGSAASTSRRARRWMLSSLLVCEAAHDI